MNREEMKKMLPIIQAYVDGKEVEYYNEHEDEWVSFDREYSFFITFYDKPEDYRIKPEPKYRPFKGTEECWNEMLKHEPFGWLKHQSSEWLKDEDESWYENVTTVMSTTVWFNADDIESRTLSFKKVMKEYTFVDGTPFGIKEGGEE